MLKILLQIINPYVCCNIDYIITSHYGGKQLFVLKIRYHSQWNIISALSDEMKPSNQIKQYYLLIFLL